MGQLDDSRTLLMSYLCFLLWINLNIILMHRYHGPLAQYKLYCNNNTEDSVRFIIGVLQTWEIALEPIYNDFKNLCHPGLSLRSWYQNIDFSGIIYIQCVFLVFVTLGFFVLILTIAICRWSLDFMWLVKWRRPIWSQRWLGNIIVALSHASRTRRVFGYMARKCICDRRKPILREWGIWFYPPNLCSSSSSSSSSSHFIDTKRS